MKPLILLFLPAFAFSQQGYGIFIPDTQPPTRDTIPCIMLVSDTAVTPPRISKPYFDKSTWTERGYDVVAIHNTAEGVIDPGFYQCIDEKGMPIPCYHDYNVHLKYLDKDKKPLKYFVWESRVIKK